jgi:hypothetical protein
MDIGGILNRAGASVADAIKGAADTTGASFEYLLAAARAESGFNPQAAATTSTARGLYQFTDQTWLATMKRSGASLGLGRYADAIVEKGGRFDVPDPALRQAILVLRDDPAANAALAGALTRDNAVQLGARLGRAPRDSELYIAHVLGSAGAAKLNSLAAVAPSAPAAAAFPAAAEANRTIFYNRQGSPRSLAQVHSLLIERYDGARALNTASDPGPPPNLPPRSAALLYSPRSGGETKRGPMGQYDNAAAALAVAPEDAGNAVPAVTAVPQASQQEPLFGGLFSDRREPVSPVVRDLWTSPPAPPGAAALHAANAASIVTRPPFPTRPAAVPTEP